MRGSVAATSSSAALSTLMVRLTVPAVRPLSRPSRKPRKSRALSKLTGLLSSAGGKWMRASSGIVGGPTAGLCEVGGVAINGGR